MFSIGFILLLVVSVKSLLSDEECLRINDKELPNDYLLGTWYDILEFRLFLSPSFCSHCRSANYTRATEADIDAFKQKYANTDLPFSFDSNIVWYEYFVSFPGVLTGETEVKFFVLHPESGGTLGELPYWTIVHNKINEDFVLRYRCVFSRTMVELISRKRNPTDEEIDAAVDALPSDVKRLAYQKICC